MKVFKNKNGVLLLNDEEFVRQFAKLYKEASKFWDEDDFEVNIPQAEKLEKIVDYFKQVADELNGEIDEVVFEPTKIHGGITVRFLAFDLFGEESIREFCEALQLCSGVSIDANIDGSVCVSCTVPYVFKFRDEQ